MVPGRPAAWRPLTKMVAPTPAETPLCHDRDVAEGQARGFRPAGGLRNVIVTRRDGALYAWLDNCPHYFGGTPMAWRRDAYLDGSGDYLACHAHGALFDIKSGECLAGPCLGQGLTPVPVTTSPEGMVVTTAPIDWTSVSA